jgi:hypothetical protein
MQQVFSHTNILMPVKETATRSEHLKVLHSSHQYRQTLSNIVDVYQLRTHLLKCVNDAKNVTKLNIFILNILTQASVGEKRPL